MDELFTPEEKDAILKGCENSSIEYFDIPNVGYEVQFARKKAIIRILYQDRYMAVAGTGDGGIIYRLTDEGLFFREWGGYSRLHSLYRNQQESKLDEQRNWELTIKKFEKSTQIKILIWSAIITIVNTLVSFLISFFFK